MVIEYMDILQGKLRLLLKPSFIGLYFSQVRGKGIKGVDGGYRYIIQLEVSFYWSEQKYGAISK